MCTYVIMYIYPKKLGSNMHKLLVVALAAIMLIMTRPNCILRQVD